jgi:hypothetical protein
MANEVERQAWIEGLTMAAPALLGGAAGLLLGEIMNRNARRGLAFALLAAGVASLIPAVTEGIVRRINGPDTARGSRRRLRGIRDAGLATGGYGYVDEALEEQAGL